MKTDLYTSEEYKPGAQTQAENVEIVGKMFLDIMGRMVIGYGGLAHNILDDARKKLGNNK